MTDEAQTAARAISDAVNRGVRPQELAEELLRDHRTLLQLKAQVFMRFFRGLAADFEAGRFDARNEAACERAALICKALDEAGMSDGMPFI